ncbi:predicted protein [Nematostella vectensis]|uniref:Oxidoreductase NAD-binding domain-containing protein 1 n=1 Tax=Nematostella vectensis TaxID=45351 RepID=A7S220_NEMVE|nr:oxidoreductase NAD-binding domain-containing protein 1 [Nematostella vectensis]EDO42208.1 predicted protein [Nematostella vectensis]|eukprot:XP_001634271.1 predicted protein [Nematostella vectensis]
MIASHHMNQRVNKCLRLWNIFSPYSIKQRTDFQLLLERLTMSYSTHTERTEQSTRQQVISKASVVDIKKLSDTVKGLTLKVAENSHFIFKPGQWVDFFAPGVSVVGGFSICSSPSQLHSHRSFELAVKYSTHPPAHWVHTKCKPGDEVQVRVGGDFHYIKQKGCKDDLLLIAGGVGINPLWSMMQFVCEEKHTGNISLLYSASTQEELLFKDSISTLCEKNPSVTCKFFVTKEKLERDMIDKYTQTGRITEDSLRSAISDKDRSTLRVLLCGPPNMTQFLLDNLVNLGLESSQIKFEKWW